MILTMKVSQVYVFIIIIIIIVVSYTLILGV